MSILERLFCIPSIRKPIWRFWYPYLTRRLLDKDVQFLNYAFETDPPVGLQLEAADEVNRNCIQLYHHVASQVDLRGKDVVEVSCGHGGGASWLSRTMQPASYVGLDLNPTGIAFCQKRYQQSGLSFVQGDAQQLPFPDQSLDAVVNVEASHCYPDFPLFLAEVARVLKPGGHLLYADFRFRNQWSEWEQAIANAPLEIVQTRDIREDVLRGMQRNASRSESLICHCLPWYLHRIGRVFAGLPGTPVYEALKSHQISYRSWCLRKS